MDYNSNKMLDLLSKKFCYKRGKKREIAKTSDKNVGGKVMERDIESHF